MRRTFNYTGRSKIPRDRIDIVMEGLADQRSANITRIDLREIGNFTGDEKVYVEAYYEQSWMRFSVGTVSHLNIPTNKKLDDLDGTEIVYFRVKVVDESGDTGKMVAIADRITVFANQDQENRESLLPVNYKPLDSEIWKLSWQEAGPVLEVNNSIPEAEHFVKTNAIFHGLVWPQVLRSVLYRILITEIDESDEEDHWGAKWIKFAETMTELPKPERSNEEDIDTWINSVLDSFCQRHDLNNHLANYLNPERED